MVFTYIGDDIHDDVEVISWLDFLDDKLYLFRPDELQLKGIYRSYSEYFIIYEDPRKNLFAISLGEELK